MVLSLKNIRKSNGVSNCTIIEANNAKYILLNRTDRIEIYNFDLEFIQNVDFGFYICLMNTVSISNKEYLILITTQDTYCIFESKLVFNIEDIKKITKSPMKKLDTNNPMKKLDTNGIYCSSLYKSSMIFKDLLLIFTSGGDVLVYSVNKDSLVFDDFPNDFKYLDVLDYSTDGMYLVFLIKDIEGNISILKYFSEDGRLNLKSKMSKGDSLHKKSAHEGLLLEGIKNLDILRNGYLSIRKDFLVYEDGDTTTTEFGNTFVKSKCHFGNKMLYSMEDGELIQIEILNKKINKSRSSQNLNSVTDSAIETILAPKKIQVTILHKFTEGFNFLTVIDKNTVLMGNRNLIELVYIENSTLTKVNKLRCSDEIQGVSFSKGNYYLWDNRRIFKMGYSLETTFKEITKMESTIYRFLIIDSLLIVGYKNRGAIIRDKDECFSVTGKILNISKASLATDEDHFNNQLIYFNTKDEIYFLNDVDNIKRVECKNILLSSFHSGRVLVYTIDRRLKLIDLQCKKNIKEVQIDLEISTIIYKDFVFISTYDNHFVIMNSELDIIEDVQEETFVHSINIKEKLFFSNSRNVVKECIFDQNRVYFNEIYRSDYPISSLSSLGDSLLIISEESVIYNLTNLTRHRIAISGISGVCYDKYYHFSKGRKIITCRLADEPTYNYFLHKYIKSTRNGTNNIINFLPEKEVAICRDEIKNTTRISKNNVDYVKINNFYSINGSVYGDGFVCAGYTSNEGYIIYCKEKYKGKIQNIENDKRCQILLKEIEEVVNIYQSEDRLILYNSNNIFYFRKNLINPVKFNIDCTIHKVYIYKDYVLILDYFRSFFLLEFSSKHNSFSIISSPYLSYKFNNGLVTDKFIVVSTKRDIFVFDRMTTKFIKTYHLGNDIVAIKSNSLETDTLESIYIFTSNSSTFLLL